MSATFTPSEAIDATQEKNWASNIGMLDWDTTNIVFTKRSLIEFLKHMGTTVDPGFGNISKLPRYAKFGVISSTDTPEDLSSPSQPSQASVAPQNTFVPSRRVRAPPGGASSDLLGTEFEDDALSTAPIKPGASTITALQAASIETSPALSEPDPGSGTTSTFVPSRRVRTQPGGMSSIGSLWDVSEQDQFVPTRRVRQRPGGEDNINNIF